MKHRDLAAAILTAGLAACATHHPPPQPEGPFRAINGCEQYGMRPPQGAIALTPARVTQGHGEPLTDPQTN